MTIVRVFLDPKADAVDKYFRFQENPPKRGHLYDHYKRGLKGIMKPDKKAKLALAAWQAGRDKVEDSA